jgi:hypothetical protein
MQKRSRSHGNRHPKHSNREERDNSTVEGGDLRTVRPEPTSGRELTNRRRNTTEDKQKSEEVRREIFILCGVVTVRLCYN